MTSLSPAPTTVPVPRPVPCPSVLLAGLFALLVTATSAPSEDRPPEVVDVEPVWSGHPVSFGLATADGRQYAAYYDAERRLSVAARELDRADWRIVKLPSRLGWDSHNGVAIAVDASGRLHVAGNMHNDPLRYWQSALPHDPGSLVPAAMVGTREERVSYPTFVRGPDDQLIFLYRDGASGRGTTIANAYDPQTRRWRRLLDRPLLDGGRRTSAYLAGPTRGPDGWFHLVWMWRESASANSNFDLSYARSRDLVHWVTASGAPLELPITPRTRNPAGGLVVDPVKPGQGLVAIGFGVGWDTGQRPIVTYCRYGPLGRSQAFNARWNGERWQIVQASDWEYRWPLDRKGALSHDIAVGPPSVDSEGRLVQWYDHTIFGEAGWVLDDESLQPTATLELTQAMLELRRVESPFPGMERRDLVFDGDGRHFLRWETLPANQDQPRQPPYPPPSMLRVHSVPDRRGGADG